jgi:Ca2+-binding RTX toxin-like protein
MPKHFQSKQKTPFENLPLTLNKALGRKPKLKKLFDSMSRLLRPQDQAQQNTFRLEQLEPRLLLSADPLAVLTTESMVTLQVIEKGASEQYLQLVDTSANTVISERKLSDIAADSTITITGSSGNDVFNVDQSFLDLGERDFIVQFDGGDGSDEVATDIDVTESGWQISGEYSGSMGTGGIVEFSNTEKLSATQSDDSTHLLSATNGSFNWQVTADNSGVLSILEDVEGSILQQVGPVNVEFYGFDEIVGTGTDYLDYSQLATGATVDLENDSATGFDKISGMQTLIGSVHSDTFTGDGNDNVFITDLTDTVDGNGGFDTVVIQDLDTSGRDLQLSVITAKSDFSFAGGNWDGTNFTATADGPVMAANDVDFLIAQGGSGANYFDFSASDVDVYLNGAGGDDILLAGSGNDILTGGIGIDQLTGGAGSDEVIETHAADFRLSTNKLRIGTDGEDTLTTIESVYLRAQLLETDLDGKKLDASGADNYHITLIGTELNDEIFASAHGDTITGNGGADSITAGAGVDILSENFVGRAEISQLTTEYSLDLAQGITEQWWLDIPAVTSGSGFTLSITDVSLVDHLTNELAWDASGRDITREIEKTLNLNFGQLSISEEASRWKIDFTGLYAGQQIAQSITATAGVAASIAQQGQRINDSLFGFSADDILNLAGSEAADYVDLSLFEGNAIINTYGGGDVIKGAAGTNTINAGAGSDTIYVSGLTADAIDGGRGQDKLVADLSSETGTAYDFNLKNHQLAINATLISLLGIESAELSGSNLEDSFNATDFYGVSETSELENIIGWQELTEHTLRITLDDAGETVFDIDLSTATSLEELLSFINEADDRETGALNASFDQEHGRIVLSGLSQLTTAGTDLTILSVLGLTSSVASSVVQGLSMSLLASLHHTSQKGNAGKDSFVGSLGNDNFIIDMEDQSVQGGFGDDTVIASTNVTHTELVLLNGSLTYKGASQTDSVVILEAVETAKLTATAGATLLDGSGSSINQILDAANTNASLSSGTSNNELRLDIAGRASNVNVTIKDTASSNNIVFYGGSDVFDTNQFSFANVTGDNYSFTKEADGDLEIVNAVVFAGQSLGFIANGTITVNADIRTDSLAAMAGNISLAARHIMVADGVTISAQGQTLANSGDISLTADDSRNNLLGLGFYNTDDLSASITIGASTIKGRDITLLARAESNPDVQDNSGNSSFSLSPALLVVIRIHVLLQQSVLTKVRY